MRNVLKWRIWTAVKDFAERRGNRKPLHPGFWQWLVGVATRRRN